MDFFAAQHSARRKSHFWIFLFLLFTTVATIAIYAVGIAGLIALIFVVLFRNAEALRPYLTEVSFVWICLAVSGAIAAFVLYKSRQIARAGGEGLAERMGGRPVARATTVAAEKRLLNVTEEMAIAAGIPPPVVYVLDKETGLNAFAAGLSARDGIVCVTKGLLEAMNRDELQGVVGHEISHLVNGDSRLNLRLTAGLYGLYCLTVLAEGIMKEKNDSGDEDGTAFFVGVPLYIAGWFGRLSAEIIQAAVSREREYLADASAAQYTRNPAGLASALQKLLKRGSRIRSPQSAAASHFFFGTAGSPRFFTGVFATHPPLTERIARLGGGCPALSREEEAFMAFLAADAEPAEVLCDRVEKSPEGGIAQARHLLAGLPEDLRRHSRGVAGAAGIVYGLFFSDQGDVRARQEQLLPATVLPVARDLRQWLSAQPEQGARHRLVWMDLVLPTLRSAPEGELRRLFALCEALLREDGRISAGEFALYSLLRGVLRPASERGARSGELRPAQLDKDISTLLALIAHAGSEDEEAARNAYQAALAASPAQSRPPLPPQSALSISAVEQSLANLSRARPPYRATVLRACAVAVRHDGKITPVETELLRAFAQSLDCPAPL